MKGYIFVLRANNNFTLCCDTAPLIKECSWDSNAAAYHRCSDWLYYMILYVMQIICVYSLGYTERGLAAFFFQFCQR